MTTIIMMSLTPIMTTTTMIRPYDTIAIRCGYAESLSTSWTYFSKGDHTRPFSSRGAALKSFTLYLYQKYLNEYLENKLPFVEEEFANWIGDFHSLDCDSWGYDDTEIYNPEGWDPWGYDHTDYSNSSTVFICDRAPAIILECLYDIRPELCHNKKVNDWLLSDYQNILNEEYEFVGYCYAKPHHHSFKQGPILQEIHYDNGAMLSLVDGVTTYVKYNTGDHVWFETYEKNDRVYYKVVKVEAADGGYPPIEK